MVNGNGSAATASELRVQRPLSSNVRSVVFAQPQTSQIRNSLQKEGDIVIQTSTAIPNSNTYRHYLAKLAVAYC